MATKKYLSLQRLEEYDELLKAHIAEGDDATLSDAKTHMDTEINKIKDGSVVVKNAEHATNADTANSATTAQTATTAETAIKATQDASGNVIAETYETKIDATAKLTESKAYTDEKLANFYANNPIDIVANLDSEGVLYFSTAVYEPVATSLDELDTLIGGA